jgi:hypothetical protein
LGNICDFTHERQSIINQQGSLILEYFEYLNRIDEKVDSFQNLIAYNYKNIFRILIHFQNIDSMVMQKILRVLMFFFIHFKTLKTGLAVMVKFSAQSNPNLF